ncbi:hypothetical protein QCA50_016942 [Cerrena zonata]|uniref:RING-type domain-containing protein n=1 Tax=Cerrena zonata TaxID=2478898 RepID=A0AAW0FRN1_9APHY
MRLATSHHSLGLRDFSHSRPSYENVSITALRDLVQAKVGERSRSDSLKKTTGKKRARSPSPDSSREKKNARLSPLADISTERKFEPHNNCATRIPAYSHTFVMEYDANVTFSFGLEELFILLDQNRTLLPLDLGKVTLGREDYSPIKIALYTPRSHDRILVLPPLGAEADLSDHDFHSKDFTDILHLANSLSNRFQLDANLMIKSIPIRELRDQQLAFRLHVEVNISILFPAICQPLSLKSRNATDDEESQRRVLNFLLPHDKPLPQRFENSIDIRFLFSILGPAPSPPSPEVDTAIQPKPLLPTLLPFQQRSIAWLLSREGKRISPEGRIIPIDTSDDNRLPLFWELVSLEGHDFYLNRLTGHVSLTKPSDDAPLGGILAEEPGLGKTLECIALILLNPAVGRNPTHRIWDSVAKIDVREVPTTLIVTPGSLAPQWIDELRKHAPTLKVLVYDGWSKVKVPISEADIEEIRQERGRKDKKSNRKAVRDVAAVNGTKIKRTSNVKQEDHNWDIKVLSKSTAPVNVKQETEDDGLVDWCTYVSGFDVVITTYLVLQQDLGVARPPPVRPQRANVQYKNVERPRSPLIMCEWYRVIMDEVQMAGGGKTEEMVSLIPRLSSFAVSGTPARSQISDMIHVLKFLRVKDVTDHWRVWSCLLRPSYAQEFAQLFTKYSIRTMKNTVKDELTIPRQTRFLVPIELGKIERHVYDQHVERALLDLGLDARGVAVTENWEADTHALRSWLRNFVVSAPILKWVLEGMKEQNWRTYMDERHDKIEAHIKLAEMKQHDESDPSRHRTALDTLLLAEKEVLALIVDIQTVTDVTAAKGESLKAQAKVAQDLRDAETLALTSEQELLVSKDKGKGKGKATGHDDDSEEAKLLKSTIWEEYMHNKILLMHRLKEAQITLHKVYFLKGDVCHVLGADYTDIEGAAYTAAEELRLLLLKNNENAAKRAMTQLAQDASKQDIGENKLYIDVPFFVEMEVAEEALTEDTQEFVEDVKSLLEEVNEMVHEHLNEQTSLLLKWRKRLISLLTRPLTSDVNDDGDGAEYSRSLETQGEVETYLQAYTALLADRREAMTSERTILAAHDDKGLRARDTTTAKRANETAYEEELLTGMQVNHQPEHQALQKQLSNSRRALMEDTSDGRAVRSVMVDLNNLAACIEEHEDPLKVLMKEGASRLRKLILDQGRLMEALSTDLILIRKAFNEHISYFRQLQELSDSIAEADWEGLLTDALANVQTDLTELEMKVATSRVRQRYLENLARTQEEGTSEGDDCCILCKCEFSRGYITGCAHIFCEGCMKAWLHRKEGKACPICRMAIQPDQLQRFTLTDFKAKLPLAAPKRVVNKEPIPKSQREVHYNLIKSDLFRGIHAMECHGSYGSKIEMLVKHLLYVKTEDPGSKTILFSTWADSLHIIQHALKANSISCLQIDQNYGKENAAKRFRTDPTIEVLLLHGERENAGLNITCVSRVILVESVVNHAFELQAIARIDCMGQTQATEVYCYYAEDTVERNILDLAARQGLSLYTKNNSSGTLNVEPLNAAMHPVNKSEVDAPTKKLQKGDFVFKTDDMLAIFFPHLFEDLEYLLPSEELRDRKDGAHVPRSVLENAVAGPSTQKL